MRLPLLLPASLLVGLSLSSCAPVTYLAQAARGQTELLLAARPVANVLQDPTTPPETARKLRLAQEARAFAVGLGLPDTRSYLTYADLGRPYVVWNVFSAPEFSTQLQTSCFPIAGCVGYRGYFSEAAAQAYADTRRTLGEDVQVGGIKAYSTLGKLPDPLTSAMLTYPDSVLVRTIFHELAHASLYAAGDTVFSESYAVAVENESMRRFLAARGTAELRAEDAAGTERAAALQAALLSARDALTELYAQPLTDTERRERKTARLERLKTELSGLNATWRGYAVRTEWNNASLGAVAAYADLVPDFEALLGRQEGDFAAFMRAAQACAQRPAAERRACLREP